MQYRIKSILSVATALLFMFPVIGQNRDSLLGVASGHRNDTSGINAYLELARLNKKDTVLLHGYASTALQLSEQQHYTKGTLQAMCYLALFKSYNATFADAQNEYIQLIELARKNKHQKSIGLAYRNYAALLKNERLYDKALLYYDTAVHIFRGTGDSLQLETLYGNIGRTYLEIDQFEKSIQYLIAGVQAYERSKNYCGLAKSYNDIGSVYERMNDNNKALTYFHKILEPAALCGSDEHFAIAYQNIGSIYYRQEKDSLAQYYTRKAYDINKRTGRKNALLISTFNLAGLANRQNNFVHATQLYEECIRIAKGLDNIYVLAHSLQNAAIVYSNLNQNNKAQQYLNNALSLDSSLADAQFSMRLYEDAATFYYEINNYKKAYEYRQMATLIKDSLTAAEKELQVSELLTRYDTEKKEKKILEQGMIIKEQHNRQELLFISLGAIIIFLIAGTLLYLQRNKAKYAKEQFAAILDAEQKERMRIARDLHDSIGQMLSAVKLKIAALKATENKEQQETRLLTQNLLDQTIQEVRSVSHNLIPEELNFGLLNAIEELCAKMSSPTTCIRLQADTPLYEHKFHKQFELSLYRIIQEILNNMVKHAAAKEILINLELKDTIILTRIKDDGTGFDTASIPHSKGLGWKNIFTRVNLLNGKMSVHSERIKGTIIQITLPQ